MTAPTGTGHLVGTQVVSRDGEEIGEVREVFDDASTGQPAWAKLHTGFLGMKSRFVPLAGATQGNGEIRVPFTKTMVKDAPGLDIGDRMTVAQENELYRYYGVRGGSGTKGPGAAGMREESGTTTPAESAGRSAAMKSQDQQDQQAQQAKPGTDTKARMGTEATGRSPDTRARDASAAQEVDLDRWEETLRVARQHQVSGKVKLHRYVDTQQLSTTATTFSEEIEVVREPMSTTDGKKRELAEGEVELELHQERISVTKEIVPMERVRIRVKRVPQEQAISERVRRERVEVEPVEHSEGAWSEQESGRGETLNFTAAETNRRGDRR